MTTSTATSLSLRPLAPQLSRARAAVARLLMGRILDSVPVRATFPDGSVRGAGGPGSPTINVERPAELFARLADNPKIGIGEGYTAGDWDAAPATDLAAFLTPFAERLTTLAPRPLLWLRAVVDQRQPSRHRNTIEGARSNISAHYDLGNALFTAFLDRTMTYSSALFDDSRPFAAQSLEEAQLRKIDQILDLAGVRAGSSVLEIGTGWGSLAIAAARRGAQVTSVTLSQEQLAYAQERVAQAGVADLVELRLQDYREVDGTYDAVVSVEMIEAVGEEYWPTYFGALARLLKPGGKVGIQSILMEHHRLRATRHSFGWIQKHIFPGGLIPSLTAIEQTLTQHTDLRVSQRRHFGLHYAETLRRWREAFGLRRSELARVGLDESFGRAWNYYLAYCEAGFASGYLDVAQLQLTRKG